MEMDVKSAVTVKRVDLDNVLDQFGLFKRYHIERMFLLFLGLTFDVMYNSNYVFAAGQVSYSCKDDVEGKSQCNPSNSTNRCSEWVYDNPNSFYAYFDLACQEWKRTLIGTVHSAGIMCGLLMVGPMSDRFGRKPLVVITGVLGAVFGILRSFSPWYWFYIAMEFMEGALGDISSPLIIMTLEMMSAANKQFAIMFGSLGLVLGSAILSTVAWLAPDWKTFLRSIYAPGFLIITFICFLDESPRWLLTRGRKVNAVNILKNAAKKNKIEIDENYLEKLSCEESEKVPFVNVLKETFKSRKLRIRLIVCALWWITSTFVNYGLTINSVSLKGNIYVNFILVALVHIPGSLIATYLLKNFKRRVPLMLSFFAGAVLCISQPFLPASLPWLSIVFYMAGKLMSWLFFFITYVYTVELFPTYTRNSMSALCSSIGRIGSIIAPQTPLLLVYWSGLPSFVFGVAALAAGLSTFLVPDIADDALPDTVRQAEALGTSRKTGGDKRGVR